MCGNRGLLLSLRARGRGVSTVADGGAFDADGTLLEVGFARDGVEGSEGDDVGVGLGEVEGHEDLTGGDDAGDAELEVGDGSAAAADGDAIVGFELETVGVDGVHLEPRVGDHVVEHFDLGGLGAGVPVLDGAAGVEDEVELGVGLLGEWIAGNGVETGASVFGGEDAVAVERFAAPLEAVGVFDLLPGEVRVVAHAAGGDALPLEEGVVCGRPAGVKFVFSCRALCSSVARRRAVPRGRERCRSRGGLRREVGRQG